MIDDTALLEELRPYAFSIAYRMLGSVTEAEDVVQEALVRVHGAVEAGTRFESPRAYVATVTTRLALDQLKSARVRRETYVGEWLPEPIVTDEGADPERHAEVADMVSYAFLALLERLSPEQRAVLLLRDVFEYEYPEIASIVGTSPENARQLASRARRQRDGAAAALRGVPRRPSSAGHRLPRGSRPRRRPGARADARRGRRAPRRRRRKGAGGHAGAPGVATTPSGRWPHGGGPGWPAERWLGSWR